MILELSSHRLASHLPYHSQLVFFYLFIISELDEKEINGLIEIKFLTSALC